MRLGRFVALKILPHEMAAGSEHAAQCARRLMHEAKSASALNHPNIITIYDTGSEAGVDYIAMEYVEGHTLAARIGRNRLRINETLQLAAAAAINAKIAQAAPIRIDGRTQIRNRRSGGWWTALCAASNATIFGLSET